MSPIQDLLRIRSDILAYNGLMHGEFAAEIARFEALSAELDDKLGKVKLLEDAQRVLEAAREEAVNILAEAQSKSDTIDKLFATAAQRSQALDERENVIRQRELDTQDAHHALTSEQALFHAGAAARQQELTQLQSDVTKATSQLNQQKEQLEIKAAKLKAAVQGV